jgi:signal transduction histidine kinase
MLSASLMPLPLTPVGTVLLVEDNPGDAHFTRSLLNDSTQTSPVDLVWVQTVEAAIQHLTAGWPCQVLLLDLGLPDSQGLEALQRLRPHAHECPVIVLTGDDTDAVGMAAVAAGAQDFLVKGSFDAGLLRRCIRFAVQRKRAELGLIDQALAAQAAALRSAQRLNEALARVADGFAAFDSAGRFTYLNARAVQLLGCKSAADLLGQPLGHEFPNAVGTPFQATFEQAMQTQEPALNQGYFPRSQRWLDARLYPSSDGLSLYFTDVTERHAAEQAMMQLQFELSELSHRLLLQEKTTTQRVAQALHDHLGQTLTVARLNLDACLSTYGATLPAALRSQADRISQLLDQAVQEVRQVLNDLRPPLLAEEGLPAALDNELRGGATADAPDLDTWLEVAPAVAHQRWPDEVEYAAFMLAREALANVRLHARARLARVQLAGNAGCLNLLVQDDGIGIPLPLLRGRAGHLGIVGMRERAIAIGAGFDIRHGPDGGTQVSLHWQARQL